MDENVVGHLRDFLFVKRLGDADELADLFVGDDLVEATDVADAEDAPPFFVFLKNLEELCLRLNAELLQQQLGAHVREPLQVRLRRPLPVEAVSLGQATRSALEAVSMGASEQLPSALLAI